MTEEPFERLLVETRLRTIGELRTALRAAPVAVLQRLAVDLVQPLMRVAEYRAKAAGSGDHWADAVATPRLAGLQPVLVRIHRGEFTNRDALHLAESIVAGGAERAALALIGDATLPATIRASLEYLVPWIVDEEGLANLMINGNLGVAVKVYEAKCFDDRYFR